MVTAECPAVRPRCLSLCWFSTAEICSSRCSSSETTWVWGMRNDNNQTLRDIYWNECSLSVQIKTHGFGGKCKLLIHPQNIGIPINHQLKWDGIHLFNYTDTPKNSWLEPPKVRGLVRCVFCFWEGTHRFQPLICWGVSTNSWVLHVTLD